MSENNITNNSSDNVTKETNNVNNNQKCPPGYGYGYGYQSELGMQLSLFIEEYSMFLFLIVATFVVLFSDMGYKSFFLKLIGALTLVGMSYRNAKKDYMLENPDGYFDIGTWIAVDINIEVLFNGLLQGLLMGFAFNWNVLANKDGIFAGLPNATDPIYLQIYKNSYSGVIAIIVSGLAYKFITGNRCSCPPVWANVMGYLMGSFLSGAVQKQLDIK